MLQGKFWSSQGLCQNSVGVAGEVLVLSEFVSEQGVAVAGQVSVLFVSEQGGVGLS